MRAAPEEMGAFRWLEAGRGRAVARGAGWEAAVPSTSLHRWQHEAQSQLDDIVSPHAAVAKRGARTAQVNHAYAMLLSSPF